MPGAVFQGIERRESPQQIDRVHARRASTRTQCIALSMKTAVEVVTGFQRMEILCLTGIASFTIWVNVRSA